MIQRTGAAVGLLGAELLTEEHMYVTAGEQ